MFSDALREMDRNTVKYMVEQQQKTIQDQAAKLEEKDAMLSEKDLLLSQQAREIERLKQMLGKNNMLHEEA